MAVCGAGSFSYALQTFEVCACCANCRSMGPWPVFPATGRGPMLHLVAAEGRAKSFVPLRCRSIAFSAESGDLILTGAPFLQRCAVAGQPGGSDAAALEQMGQVQVAGE